MGGKKIIMLVCFVLKKKVGSRFLPVRVGEMGGGLGGRGEGRRHVTDHISIALKIDIISTISYPPPHTRIHFFHLESSHCGS